ncbi:unnamed protein product [Calicophoron daubneyi]|uniref:DNA-directed primase/polymerase protein n=1 Tax=Calicophoron daubneyi TaxID=300641 RepID=A0AAV2TJ72_CALDB
MSTRRWNLEAAAARVSRIPRPYLPSLTGPTAVRKVFRKQEDALNFTKEFGTDLMVFSYESQSLDHAGQRLFLASGPQSFFHYYRQMPSVARCHYEVIPTFRPAKLYLDLEFSRESNPRKDGQAAVKVFLKAVISAMKFFYDAVVTQEEVIILDASTEKKFSQHVIFNSPNSIFEDNLEQDTEDEALLAELATTVESRCINCNKALSGLIEQFLRTDQIQASDAASCFALPPPHSVPPEAVNMPPEVVSVCDHGVYTRNRNFRLAGSHKLSGTSVLWPLSVGPVNSLSRVWSTWKQWASTLVTFTQFSPSKLLHRPVPDCSCGHKLFALLDCAPHLKNEVSTTILNPAVDIQPYRLASQLPEPLSSFISVVLQHWLLKDRLQKLDQTASRALGEAIAIRRWKVHDCGSQRFTLKLDGLRYCERIGRPHRSNHIVLVFDLVRGCYYQKCLDPDCRSADYRSPTWPIPRHVLESTTVHLQSPSHDRHSLLEDELSLTEEDLMLCEVLEKTEHTN